MLEPLRSPSVRLLLTCAVALGSYGAIAEPAGAADQLVMQATQRLRLKGCGKQRDEIAATLRVEQSPAWSLDLGAPPAGGSSLAGSYTVAGRGDKRVALQTDAAGVAALGARMEALATALCSSETGADGVEIKAFKLVRGKKAARFKLTAKFTATTGKRGNLSVRGKGVLEPAPTTSTTTPASTTSTSIIGPSSTTAPSSSVTSTTKPSTTITSTTTVTSTTIETTTTITSTSSTTTTLNECQGFPDGTGCTDDGNICTNDVCSGGVCTHPARPNGSLCGGANGSPCDATDVCEIVFGVGIVCQDRKSTSFCPGPIEAQFPCNQPGFLMCNGQGDDCPAEPLCIVGDPCSSDGDCQSGSCNGGICTNGDAPLGASCDSTPDCFGYYECSDGICLGSLASFCVSDDQCGAQLTCDADGSGECRISVGLPCVSDADCEERASCVGAVPPTTLGVCRLDINESCSTNDECGTGVCSCPALSCTQAPPITCQCVPQGVCKVPFGGVCNGLGECADQLRLDGRLASGYERARGRLRLPDRALLQRRQRSLPEDRAGGALLRRAGRTLHAA